MIVWFSANFVFPIVTGPHSTQGKTGRESELGFSGLTEASFRGSPSSRPPPAPRQKALNPARANQGGEGRPLKASQDGAQL